MERRVEEDPPAVCDSGDTISAATCYGDYCDNTALSCAETNYPVYYRYWTGNFSEESGGLQCGVNEIMTGISCSGSYCDNVSIECSGISATAYNCNWLGPVSAAVGVHETSPVAGSIVAAAGAVSSENVRAFAG